MEIHCEPSELMDDGSSVCTLFSVMNHVCYVADISLEGQTLPLTFAVLIRRARWKDEVTLVIPPNEGNETSKTVHETGYNTLVSKCDITGGLSLKQAVEVGISIILSHLAFLRSPWGSCSWSRGRSHDPSPHSSHISPFASHQSQFYELLDQLCSFKTSISVLLQPSRSLPCLT